MKIKFALWYTVISLSINFNLLSQEYEPNIDFQEEVLSHIKPGMTSLEIDSLHEIVDQNTQQNNVALEELIISAQRANQNVIQNKSDACELENWGFENGNTTNWQTLGCVEIQNGGNDIYSGYSKVNNGNFSLKLSNDQNMNCINSAAARTYSVPPSGETFITIHFAVNIFNFPHNANHAAKFNFGLYDENLNELVCPTYQAYFAADQGPVGIPSLQETPYPAAFYNPSVAGDMWFNSNVSYSNWHHVTIDLSDYAGTDVTLVFENQWCVFNVDWIYTYIDVDCPVNTNEPVSVCSEGEVELCAPQGMEATYTWAFNDLPLASNSSCITTNNSGTYTLNFMPTYLECKNSAYELNFEIVYQPIAEFSVAEFCIGESVEIQHSTELGVEYEWYYNNMIYQTDFPNIDYTEGEDEIMLIAIRDHCRDTIIQTLVARKKPIPKFTFENECLGVPYKISNHSSDPENGPLDILWNISPDYQSNDWNPTFNPINNQEFVISLEVTNQFGCSSSIESKAKAFPLPMANFYQSENSITENAALVYFQDASSEDVTNWQWVINNQEVYNGKQFYHEFIESGQFQILLIVQNEFSCYDTVYNEIEVVPSLSIYVPNSFSPNNDEHNNLFQPVFSGLNLDRNNYSFQIFDRWGEIVFQSNDISEGWDGLKKGISCSQGTYSWKIYYKELSSKKIKQLLGHVNLLL